MSHTKTFKITPTYFDHQMILINVLLQTSVLVGLLCIGSNNVWKESEIILTRFMFSDKN
jgi:hypothetical protein